MMEKIATRLRLQKMECVLLTVAMLSVLWFGNWLKTELGRAEQARSFSNTCAGPLTADLLRADTGTVQCGVVSREPGKH